MRLLFPIWIRAEKPPVSLFKIHVWPASPGGRRSSPAFTLIELLTVIAILGLLLAGALPALTAIGSSQGVNKASADVASTLELARSYAMANNTYVFVGFSTSDVTSTALPVNGTGGVGKLWMGVAASRDGTGTSNTLSASNAVAISRLVSFDNVQLMDPTSFTSTNLARYISQGSTPITSSGTLQYGWPLDTRKTIQNFSYVLQFDPQGSAEISSSSGAGEPWVLAGLAPTHGNKLPAPNPSNWAALCIDELTGAVRIIRP